MKYSNDAQRHIYDLEYESQKIEHQKAWLQSSKDNLEDQLASYLSLKIQNTKCSTRVQKIDQQLIMVNQDFYQSNR